METISDLRLLLFDSTELLKQHARLAKRELAVDAGFLLQKLGMMAGSMVLAVVGYVWLCVAAVLALRQFLEPQVACLVVGAFNALVGFLGVWVALKGVQKKKILAVSSAQLNDSLRAIFFK